MSEPVRTGPARRASTRFRVRLFGPFRESVGRDEIAVTLPEGSTVRELVEALRGEVAALPASPTVAVDLEYVSPDRILRAGDEVALIPPVAGG